MTIEQLQETFDRHNDNPPKLTFYVKEGKKQVKKVEYRSILLQRHWEGWVDLWTLQKEGKL